jgi:Na+-driven multidrug efflux pump
MAELIGVIFFTFAPILVGMFNRDPEVVRYGVTQARVQSLFYCLLAFSHVIAGICRGAGKAVVPMVVMLSVWCVFRIMYITAVMKLVHEIHLIYWAYPITWSISSIIFLIYYLKSDWVHGFEKRKG